MFRAYQHRGPKYKKLNQYDGADSTEDEDVIFEGDTSAGRARPKQQRLGRGQDEFMFSSYDVDEDLRLPSESAVRGKRGLTLPAWCTYRRCLLAVLLGASAVIILAAVIFWFFFQYYTPAAAHAPSGPPLSSSPTTQTPSESLTSPVLGESPSPASPIPGHSPSPTTQTTSHIMLTPSESLTSPVLGESPSPASPIPGHSPGPTSPTAGPVPDNLDRSTINYTREFPQSLTEMTPEFYDLDGDGVLDILLSLGNSQSVAFDFWKCHGSEVEEARQACMNYFGFYPCGGFVVALDGRTGQQLWRYNAKMEVFSVTCPHDLNSDGAVDCMLCGRGGMWEAVDGRTGEFIWSLDYTALNPLQNLYFPLAVGDLDKDGTMDFVNVNSGDPRYDPANHNRPPGRVVVVSGKTGGKLLEPLLVPDMRESYMSPVPFRDDDGHDFILIGTGGETVEGGLWGITLDSLQKKVEAYLQAQVFGQYSNNPANNSRCHEDAIAYMDRIVPSPQPQQYTIKKNLSKEVLDGFYLNCPETIFHPVPNEHDLCVYLVMASPEKGVILPPVIVDMNDDQVDDIVISLYCGHTLVMDGKNGDVIWDRYIPGTESYSIPAPLFYTNDPIPDLLVRVNKGAWGKSYDYSYVALVDGADGSLLWAHNSSGVGFMSATTLRGKGYGNDAVLFISVGSLETLPLKEVKTMERVTKGKVVPHEWSSNGGEDTVRQRREVEAVADKSFSITDELDTRLGLIKKRSSTRESNGPDDDIQRLNDLLGTTDSQNETGTVESTSTEGGSELPAVEPSGDSSMLGVPDITDSSALESSSRSPSFASSPHVAVQVASTTTLSSSVAHSSSSSGALTATQQTGSRESGASVSPSASDNSKHDSQAASRTVDVTESSQPIGVSKSQVVEKPSVTTSSVKSSQAVVLSSSAVASPSTSEPASSSQRVASSSSSVPVQSKSSASLDSSLVSSASQTAGDSPPSNSAVMSSTSSSAEAVRPTNQVPPVDAIHSTSLGSSSAVHSTSHPQTTPTPPTSPYGDSFVGHMGELSQSVNYLLHLRDKGWLDFTEDWEEVYGHNPVNDTEQFITEDCKMQSDSSSHVYFLTRAMIEKGHIHPLYHETRRVSYPNVTALNEGLDRYHHDRPRRHEGSDHPTGAPDHDKPSDADLRRDWGCMHIIHPGTIASTPSFADLDGDGRVELVYFVSYGSHYVQAFPSVPFNVNTGADMMFMRVVTLEAAFQERLAPKLDGKVSVDFSTFLQYSRQPWTKYMGSSGDSHYKEAYEDL